MGCLVSSEYVMQTATITRNAPHDQYKTAVVLAISFLLVFLQFAWQGNKGFNLWDEGFLWYGVQRVLLGEVPILDFIAYDPGRYYWSAALLSIVGDNGIMGVRVTVAVFQALGLFVVLLLVARSGRGRLKNDASYWIASAAILVVWMFPRHKLFDISLSIMLLGVLSFLASRPSKRRYFFAGVCVGLVAVFGRNHGVYGAVASLGMIGWLHLLRGSGLSFPKGLLYWGSGVVVGYLPIGFMAMLIPGFAAAFWESILFLFEIKATNLSLPVPWPWTVNFSDRSVGEALRGILIGLFFMGTLLFGGVSILWVVRRRLQDQPVPPALAAAAFLAVPYAHFAFSRADVGHLAQGIFPLLLGCLVALANVSACIKWPLTAALWATSFWVMHAVHPGWQCLADNRCVTVEISGNKLLVDSGTAGDIALLRQLTMQFAPNGQTFIATPLWPGAYALLERKSPVWEIYALFPRSMAFENREIQRIKASRPGFAFVFDLPLDGREELRFKNTHPLIHQYVQDNFEPMKISQNPAYQIYRARGERQ